MLGVLPSGDGWVGEGSREKWVKSGKRRRKKNTIGLKIARILPENDRSWSADYFIKLVT